MTITVITPKDYTNPDVDNIVRGNSVNVFSFIPSTLQSDILNSRSTTDVSSYLNAAHAAAGIGGHVYYPPGTYLCSNVAYYDAQTVRGAGATSTQLSKAGLVGKGANSILVPYNYLNDIPLRDHDGAKIQDLSFAADALSTDGYAVVCSATRARITDCTVFGSLSGQFGGFRVTTNTFSGFPFPAGDSNVAGIHFINNQINQCTKGALIAQSTLITAINPGPGGQHYVVLSRAVNGTMNGSNTYTDDTSNTTFTGVSNGTNQLLVSNITGLSVGDLVEGPDVITDLVTDLYMTMNIIQACGSPDGTIACIDSAKMQGWQIQQNKLEHSQGPIVNVGRQSHSLLIANNLFDYKPIAATGGNNICLNIYVDPNGRTIVIGNQFKCSNIPDVTKQYTIVNWLPDFVTPTKNSSANMFCCNIFDIPDGAPPSNFTAFNVNSPGYVLGTAFGNGYDVDMTTAMRGNGDQAWAPAPALAVVKALTALAGGGQPGATALVYGMNEVSVCATNGDSVKLPPASGTGISVEVGNDGAATLAVFPSTGDSINRGAANASVSIASGSGQLFRDFAAGKWRTIP